MSRWLILLICTTFLVGCATIERSAGIYQIVESRDGHRSVWGVAVRLADAQFNPVVKRDELSIVESKHNAELKDLMTWSVDHDRHTLRIVFKPGAGDFGTGNAVHVRIERSATTGYTGIDNAFDWEILTDPL